MTDEQGDRKTDEQGDERRGAQLEDAIERQSQKNPSNRQNLEKPAPGRDEAPGNTPEQRERGNDSPWMGGG